MLAITRTRATVKKTAKAIDEVATQIPRKTGGPATTLGCLQQQGHIWPIWEEEGCGGED
jgi:hypothetical protein